MPRTISFGTDTDHINMKSNLVEYLVIIFYRNRDNFFLGRSQILSANMAAVVLTNSFALNSLDKVEFYYVLAFYTSFTVK